MSKHAAEAKMTKRKRLDRHCIICSAEGCTSESFLPLCDDCLLRVEAFEGQGESFRSSYCCPEVILEVTGSNLARLLKPLLLPNEPAPSGIVQRLDAAMALERLGSPDIPLLILTGSGCSASLGIPTGYGPPYSEGVGVNVKYWPVYEASRVVKEKRQFYAGLVAFLRQTRNSSSVCVATSNIDGLCPVNLGLDEPLIELHGSVKRAQCSSLCSLKTFPSQGAATHDLGICPICTKSQLRFNVCSFDDWPDDVVGTEQAQSRLHAWVQTHISRSRLSILCVGCSDHVHSMVHEARAIAHVRKSLYKLDTTLIVSNIDEAAALACGQQAIFVQCDADDLFSPSSTTSLSF